MEKLKLCPKCKKLKVRAEFHKNKRISDGLAFYCKVCFNKIWREYYQKNSEHYKVYYQEHKEKYQVYYQEHKNERHPYYQTYYQEHKAEIWAKIQRRNKTPKYRAKGKIYEMRRRSILKTCDLNDLSNKEIFYMLEKTIRCPICKKLFNKKRIKSLDHILAISRGGSNTLLNSQIICTNCNSVKSNRDYTEFTDGQLLLFIHSPDYFLKERKRREKELAKIKRIGKKCTRCKMIKPIDSFYKNEAAKDGHAWACKQCEKISDKRSRKKVSSSAS